MMRWIINYFRQKAEEVRNQKSEVRKNMGCPRTTFLPQRDSWRRRTFYEISIYAVRGIPPASYGGQGSQKSEVGCQRRRAPWDLVLLGDGPLKTDICRLISDLRLNEHVHLPGFKPYDELPVYYALANAFVHASATEQWGLVVNEAIASGYR